MDKNQITGFDARRSMTGKSVTGRIYLMLPNPQGAKTRVSELMLQREPAHTRSCTVLYARKIGNAMEFLLGLGVGTSLGASLGVLVVAWLRASKEEGGRHDYAKPDQSALVDVWDSRDGSHIPSRNEGDAGIR